MTIIVKRDQEILGFIAARQEVFFKELEDSGMMAKSTLSKHLMELRRNGLVEKNFSKKRKLGSHDVVYVLTKKGQKLYYELQGVHGAPVKLKDYF